MSGRAAPPARRLALVTLLIAVAVVGLPLVLPPVRTVVLTGALVPDMLATGVRPLAWLPEPRRATMSYGRPADRMDVYVPYAANAQSHLPAVVLALGVHPQPIDDPEIVRLATAISRLSVVVGVPDSTALRNLRVTPAEPSHLADAVIALSGLPEVDGDRVGLAGFSAGASLALVAAADERIAERLRFVSAFGGYARAELLLIDVATRTTVAHDAAAAWRPDAGIRRDVFELLLGTLSDEPQREDLRRRLTPVIAADTPPTGPRPEDLAQLTGEARSIYLLFSAADRVAAGTAVESLSLDLRAQLAGISPTEFADRVRAPVFLLHGEPDTAIPVAHVALLATAIGDEVVRLTRFGQFGHEQPGRTGLSLDDAGDVWELALYLRDIVAAATE